MIRQLIKYTVYFLFLIVFQIAILNNINFAGSINPYFYIVFILALPFDLSRSWVLILSFLLGFTIDIFVYTPGIHAAATVFTGFSRNIILPYLEPRDGYDPGTHPSVGGYGWGWYLKYAAILVSLHHIALFFIDAFSFKHPGHTIKSAFASVVFTLLLVIFTQSGNSKRKVIRE